MARPIDLYLTWVVHECFRWEYVNQDHQKHEIFTETASMISFKIYIILVILNIYNLCSYNISDKHAWKKLQPNM